MWAVLSRVVLLFYMVSRARWLPCGCIQLAAEMGWNFQKYFSHMLDASMHFCAASLSPCSQVRLPHSMVNRHLTWWPASTRSESRSFKPQSLKLYSITTFYWSVTALDRLYLGRWKNRLLQVKRGMSEIQGHVLQFAMLTNLQCHDSSERAIAPNLTPALTFEPSSLPSKIPET